tara:strand:- start:3350 stop:5362 length:2013 start_codon:yes stop_codon:yes gene_type:complete
MKLKEAYKIILALSFIFKLAFGQSIQDLQNMKKEYDKLKSDQERIALPGKLDNNLENEPRLIQLKKYSPTNKDSTKTKSKYFGYDFFTKRDSVGLWENLPATSNYFLGPGDKLVLSIWGETQLRKTYTISRSGNIYDDKVGLLNLSGKTPSDALAYLRGQFGRIYSTLVDKNPKTFMDLSLSELRSINVNFVGEVKFPGVYPIHPFSTILTGLIQAGGVDTTGSLRELKLIRNGENDRVVDLYDYFLKGSLAEDIQLKTNDIIFIPIRISTVKIDSAVMRPGIYEIKSNENLEQLIDFAGGPTNNASGKISIKRILPLNERGVNISPFSNFYVDIPESKKIIINDGDEVVINKIYDVPNGIEVIGQVKKPGNYTFFEGMRVMDLIELTGLLSDSSYKKSVFLQKAKIVRRNPDNAYQEVIEIDLESLINGNQDLNILLDNLDKLVIHANPNYFPKKNVIIFGEVNIPGSYPLIRDNETLKSLIDRSGGLTSKAQNNGISIFRQSKYVDTEGNNEIMKIKVNKSIQSEEYSNKNKYIKVAWRNDNIRLMPGDSIQIKEKTGTINVAGEVYNPGLVEFQPGKSINYYINSVGGVTQKGSKKDIIIVYSNGFVEPNTFFFKPKIQDGASIIVNQKEDKRGLNLTEFATTSLSIISTTVTILVLSQQLSANSGN